MDRSVGDSGRAVLGDQLLVDGLDAQPVPWVFAALGVQDVFDHVLAGVQT